MPYSRPTLTALRAQAGADIASSVQGTDGLLRFTNLGVLGALVSKAQRALYGYLDWIARQAVPFTATGEFLEGWAALKRVYRKAATQAQGSAVFTGTPGVVIPAGSQVVRGDGLAFQVVADAIVGGGGSATASVICTVAGATGNTPDGAAMTLGQAVAGVAAAGSASGAITGGAEVEKDDELRSRMLQAYAAVPQGGAEADYVDWALDAPGVTRAWCRPLRMGAGTVVVYFMMDEAEAAYGGFPQGSDGVAAGEARAAAATGDQLAVANAILPLQPVTALVYACSPLKNLVTLTISLPNASLAMKAAIDAEVAQILVTNGSPDGVIELSDIEGAIRAISGTAGFVITNVAATHGAVTPGSAGNITSATGYIPVGQPSVWA